MLTVGVGPISLALPHVILLSSLVLALVVGWWVGRRTGNNPEPELFKVLFSGLLVARLAFVVSYYEHFIEAPWRALDIRDGGFIAWPGALAAIVVGGYLAWRHLRLRKALLWAMAVGLLSWLTAMSVVSAFEQGTRLPTISLRDAQGHAVQLDELEGKPIVVNLWATWCPPCRREMPVLAQAQASQPDVLFLFVNQGESSAQVEQFLREQGLQLDNLLFDSSGRLGQKVGSGALPTTLFYAADGRQVKSHLGELSSASLAHALKQLEASSVAGGD